MPVFKVQPVDAEGKVKIVHESVAAFTFSLRKSGCLGQPNGQLNG